ncbi:hypothetical protein A0256_13865 [Mucilaginibacter sp. PAMC 26640]|nr:hypothetical protein A0256_13865 [Mucilaginibacter sp. PAMC 26640]
MATTFITTSFDADELRSLIAECIAQSFKDQITMFGFTRRDDYNTHPTRNREAAVFITPHPAYLYQAWID